MIETSNRVLSATSFSYSGRESTIGSLVQEC